MKQSSWLILGAVAGTLALVVGSKKRRIAAAQEAVELYEKTTGDMKSYFTIAELCASDTAKKYGIDNTPTDEARYNLQQLINNVLDPARRRLGKAIYVSSGYRSPELNRKVGGVSNSQHQYGLAADITARDMNKLFAILVSLGNFDQLIWEHPKSSKWIHVSYNPAGANRAQILDYNGKQYTNIANNWQAYLA